MTASEERLRHYLRKVTLDLQESRQAARRGGRTIPRADRDHRPGMPLPGGVRTPEDLWELVSTGVDAIGPYPGEQGLGIDEGGRLDQVE